MKAPDKIYLVKDAANPEGIFDTVASKKPMFQDDVCYIRKDALLEYFHNRVEELNSPLNGVFGSTEREHCNERISELLLLVDKLNEM